MIVLLENIGLALLEYNRLESRNSYARPCLRFHAEDKLGERT